MSAGETTVAVRAVFHTAHRLPALPGKCASLHGHTWQAWWHLAGPVDADGVLADFGALKDALRGWCDAHLDHGTMLGLHDPLIADLEEAGTKVYKVGFDRYSEDLAWPTVETVAQVLCRVAADLVPAPVTVACVEVAETENNRAVYTPAQEGA